MEDKINIEIKVSESEYEKLIIKKGSKTWKEFLLECATTPNPFEKFGIINLIETLAVDILTEKYEDARITCKQILSWLDEKSKEKEERTTQEQGG